MTDTSCNELTELFGIIAWAETPELRTAAEDAIRAMLKPRTITTVEELDALAAGSVVRSSAGTIACRFDSEYGVVFGMSMPFPWKNLAVPATVMHDGGAE